MSVIAVVGAGVMGVDVASTLSFHGYKVIVKDIDATALQQIPQKIERNIRNYRMISSALREWDAEDILSRITVTNTYEHFSHASWVIENITEDWEAKSRLYRELGEVCSEDTFYGVNTSCISPTKIASLLDKPEKVIGMHFMNPVPLRCRFSPGSFRLSASCGAAVPGTIDLLLGTGCLVRQARRADERPRTGTGCGSGPSDAPQSGARGMHSGDSQAGVGLCPAGSGQL
ncbi:hypothetical protein J6TS7_17880 [Paenibacillus dendritiformis]|nr:hypothetical protein J6TS7_17880 [Paenibacillus dendritiformis]